MHAWQPLVLLLGVAAVVEPTPAALDLQRARQWTPRPAYRGSGMGLIAANLKLNSHLATHANITARACEEFQAWELRDLLRSLHSLAAPGLTGLYSQRDGRRAQYASSAHMEASWQSLPSADPRVRDAHCHQAVMWYVHHLSSADQATVRSLFVLPLLPRSDHRGSSEESDDPAAQFYISQVTCQDCHTGGMSVPPPGPPEPPPRDARERSRRCDTDFAEKFGIDCGPCDGIDGIATGDQMRFYNQTECAVVALPGDVSPAERVPVAFPEAFTAEVIGSADHFGVHSPGRVYSLSHGVMYGDVRSGSDLWLLRHDNNFTHFFQDGRAIPLGNHPSSAQIHSQTRDQRLAGEAGPQVELSTGMPSWSGDSWTEQGFNCSCHLDVVGIPTFETMKNLQYLGRIRLCELEFAGGAIELDHWANWFFHIFMDTNKTAPHYRRAPSRLSDSMDGPQKTGFSVYGRWVFGDPAVKDPDVWRRGVPTASQAAKGARCLNPGGVLPCQDISQSTFPPKTTQ